MKGFTRSLRNIFAPAASAIASVSLAISLMVALPSQAQAKVMDQGPTSVVLKQLERDGYEPVGAGVSRTPQGKTQLVSFWKNANDDWIQIAGNKKTSKVQERGTDLSVTHWAPTSQVSYELVDETTPAQQARRNSRCLSFEDAEEIVLKRQFVQANLISGTTDSGEQMNTYVENGMWLSISIDDDDERTTCPIGSGYKFKLVSPPQPKFSS